MQNTTTETKRVWQSKTLLSLLPILLSLFLGGNIEDPEVRDGAEKLAGAVTVIGVIVGRLTAKKSVTL